MIRAFRLGYIEIGTNAFEAEQHYYDQTIGATLSLTDGNASYFSLGLDHHNVALVRADRSELKALGLWVAGGTASDIAADLSARGLNPRMQHDSRPGVAELVAVEIPGGIELHLFPEMQRTSPGFRKQGVAPVGLGHVALASADAPRAIDFLENVLGFRTTDWIDELATFMTCNHDHHVVNIIRAPVPAAKVHHIAFGLRDAGQHYQAADMLGASGLPIVWGPSRHTAGHNYASYHFDPSGYLIEFYSDMDIFIPELNHFEPRPWHDTLPQVPKVWPAADLSTWRTKFAFDFTSILAI